MASAADKTAITRIHPFEWDKLTKDSWIETHELEQATLRKRDNLHFAMAVQNLIVMIERKTGILARAVGNAHEMRVRLMSDSEAVSYTVKAAAEASRKLDKSARRLRDNIDRSQLSEVDSAIHDHAQRVVSAMADAQRRERDKALHLFELCRPALMLGEGAEDDELD